MLAFIRVMHLIFGAETDGAAWMASIIDFVILFFTAFGFNLIPFAGPSNLLIASTAAIGMVNADTTTLIVIGFVIAFAAAVAKGIY